MRFSATKKPGVPSKDQGLKVGDILDVYSKGKSVKNPQTGMDIVLPGKKIGQLKVESFTGEPSNEVALAGAVSGEIPRADDAAVYSGFYLEESK